jgi:adiponectin receptor
MQEDFLESGYRIGYSHADCLRSVFEAHNETWSIWTHLVALASWLVLLWFTFCRVLPPIWRSSPGSLRHHVAMGLLIVPNIASMTSSVVFHTFRSMDEATYAALATVDFLLIVLVVAGTQVGQVLYAFWDHDALRRRYSLAITVLGVAGAAYCSVPSLTHPAFRVIRTCVFVGIGCFDLVVTCHAAWLVRANRQRVLLLCRWVLVAYLLAGLAVVVYIPRFPERFWPGVFDNTLQSHVLMHLFLMATEYAYWWHYFINFRAISEKDTKKAN